MKRFTLALLGTVLGALGAFAQDPNDSGFEKTFAYVVPKDQDQSWRQITWRPVLWDAVIEAHEKDMPILFWGMNGHPLACT